MAENKWIWLLAGAGGAFALMQLARRSRMRRMRGGGGYDGGYAPLGLPDQRASRRSAAAYQAGRPAPLHSSQTLPPPAPLAPAPEGTKGTLGGERF